LAEKVFDHRGITIDEDLWTGCKYSDHSCSDKSQI